MKPRLPLWLQVTVFPQHVRARERRVATEIDFDRGCEPAQVVPVFLRNKERSLGEIHFAGDVQHPGRIGSLREDADPGRIAREGTTRECVDLREYLHHLSIANGSLMELETQLTIASRRDYVAAEDLQRALNLSGDVGRLLSGLVRALKAHIPRHRTPDTYPVKRKVVLP